MRAVRDAGRPPDAEQVALAGGSDLALLVLVGEVDEHLDFDAARVAGADSRQRIGPDKEAAVADRARFGRHVHPVELRDEVLVLLLGPQIPRRLARGYDLAILHEERIRVTVDIHPAGEVPAVEHRHKALVLVWGVGEGRHGDGQREQKGGSGTKWHHGWSSGGVARVR